METIEHLLNTIQCCDAMELLRAIPDGSIDLVVTSPPYNMRTQTNGAKASSKTASNWGKSALLDDGYEDHGDNLPHADYVRWQRSILTECLRVVKDTGAIFYNHKWRIQGGLLDMRDDIVDGFPVRQVIIWNRGSGNNHNRAFFSPQYEVIYMITKHEFYIRQDATKYGDVWDIKPESNSNHPAPFPVTLAERIIKATDAQIILDPFMGSGTVAVATVKLNRQFIGCDISQKYVDMATERLNQPRTMNMFEAMII